VHSNSTNTSSGIEIPQTLYTGPSPEELDRLPADLKARPQWVLWRGAGRIDHQTGESTGLEKIPIDPHTLHHASTTDTETWGTFKYCVDALPVALEQWENEDPSTYRGGGVGYVFTNDDSYTGIDLDHCRDADTGAIADWAQTWIDTLNSYTQVSVSGTGVHVIVEATLPPGRRQSGNFQMWDHSRFFAMTGQHIPGTLPTIEPRGIPLTALWCTLFAPKIGETVWTKDTHGNITNKDPLTITAIEPAPSGELYARFAESQTGWPLVQCELASGTSTQGATPALEDDAVLDKARKAKNSDKFNRLWDGDIVAYPSPSEADLALCCILAFWTRDATQIDRLFRQSNLMREKWEKRTDYRKRTITAALTLQAEHYTQLDGTQLIVKRTTQQAQQGQNGSTAGNNRPTIFLDTELSRWTDEGQAALLTLTKTNGAPILYQRARRLALIATGVKPPRWLHRPPDAPIIIEASDAALYELAGMAATWQKWEKRVKEWVTILPPKLFVSTLLGRPYWPFPPLEGIIYSPTLRPDGSLLATPGYDADTGLYFDSNRTRYKPIPDNPDIFEARKALNTLNDVLCDFLWEHDYDRSAALAAILSVVCRYTVIGNVPLFGISATTRGSGKGLLADVIVLIGTGRRAPLWSQAEDDAEERKRLLALGMDGDPLVCIDNVTRPLGSGPLDLALTSSTFKDRILGTQTSKEVPMHVVFLATGNNLQYVGDLARRVVPITLDPKMEKPEERTGFRYPDLLAHVAQERPQLVIAALTILKAYFADGCPSQGLSAYGSFQPWSDLIRSALVWAGEEDPCEGRKTIEAHDPGYEALAGLLEAWHTCYPAGAKITLKRLKQDITIYKDSSTPPAPNEWDDLEHAVFEFDPRSARTKAIDTLTLGNALKRVHGRVIDKKRFVSAGTSKRAVEWKVEDI
jgi:hypothetical protein